MFLKYLFNVLIFPGFLFATVLGLIVGWVERKVSARVQFRVGPPFLQNFYDVFKLWGKEIVLIKNSPYFLFIIAPIIAFASVIVTTTLVGMSFFYDWVLVLTFFSLYT